MQVTLGPAVDLDDLQGQPLTAQTLREATDRIMDAVTALVEDLRGQSAPATRVDPRDGQVAAIGDAHVHYEVGGRPARGGWSRWRTSHERRTA